MANDKVYADYLMHGRTKGSKNGISTTKGYTAVGQKAKGHLVNGRYVYDTPKSYGGNVETTQSGRVTKPLSPYVPDEYLREVEYNSRKNDGTVEPHPTAASVNAHHNAYVQSETNKKGMNAAYEYAQKQKARKSTNVGASQAANSAYEKARLSKSNKPTNIGASQAGNTARAMTEYGNRMTAERKAKEAALGRQKKASKGTSFSTYRDASGNVRVTHKLKADNTSNNWQQTANKTAGILGNMSREDRSLMKSHETRYHDKNGKLHINGGFNVNNKYGYSNYTKNDKGWHDVHIGEYNTTGVKGVKKQQDWNTSFERNHRSDIGNAIADAKVDAKKAFKEAKADAKQTYVNLKSKLKSKFKKKKK